MKLFFKVSVRVQFSDGVAFDSFQLTQYNIWLYAYLNISNPFRQHDFTISIDQFQCIINNICDGVLVFEFSKLFNIDRLLIKSTNSLNYYSMTTAIDIKQDNINNIILVVKTPKSCSFWKKINICSLFHFDLSWNKFSLPWSTY